MLHYTPLFVILAGGQGQRFAPLVTNKTVFPFLNKPLLFHQLEQLQRVGVAKVLIATNSENHDYLKKLNIEGLEIKTKRQSKPLGMADAVLHLAKEIGEQPIVIMNAVDVVSDDLFKTLLRKIKAEQTDGLVTGIRVNKYFPGGYLQLEDKRVTGIVEKPKPGQEPSDLVNLVFHYFSQPQEFIKLLKQATSEADDVYELALTELMEQQHFGFVSYDGYWSKLKYPHFVLDVMQLFLDQLETQIDPSAQISDQAVIEGHVFIDKNVKVEAGAVIKGPAYIGPNAIVGNHALVRQSMVEQDAIIGFGSEVARSYIGPDCALHSNFIGDSVLEAEVNPSFGTVTTNWRLDKQNIKLKTTQGKIDTHRDKLGTIFAKGVFCGVNCSIMPGVTIGANTKIYPGSVIYKALPADTTHKTSQD
ncbi:MAG: NTP transferase domain-containing protein [Candidatus Pacebacteria bacterium]|jgi:UDP-N-acetylglucosamine diphosphorylase / glucose-1-phosphate thymidylyltransferase / UDP-N-acetylgalactosamine diphosphorylase / glucosamine-1-phosphate N-acetyltransferase / galactosamine-1-phosphate N-acetyltransferase|nr:NTP transferase domain-containing protein [Candidatus Paceibacterota bacterium]MBT3512290.1 NTP transferase domain-containing protein [Candidatus Paceibacterota bacterium]MBT4004516.1 NTP transferase domain-containing protein [Candidatus Paceibacterota bacterium]MBT4358848.1 NTP transferase domain-containing protein [Candidatus Paceibacterota bacterium]MBT4681203.1 NTP transferase domain-containing protein [Candidatus Paceibacterota bacterium]